MQFPESWLREFCNPPLSSAELAETLTMAGLEVEERHPAAPAFSQIVVGHILEAAQHPNADRLRVCTVDVGQGTPLNIVCGAPNARAGIKVPCALVGAVLPPDEEGQRLTIKLGKLRGVESQGMLCSARELRLSEEHSGLLELALDAPVGQDLRQHLQLDDQIFTLKLTPNLAHALSVYGIAREVSALTGAPLLTPEIAACEVQIQDRLNVQVQAPDLCGRFSGRIVRGVNPKAPTPAWMVERLARCGQRSVNALVDISNYVMFEYGRPSHIFDLDKIQGDLQVRWGRKGESLKLLNGQTIEVDESVGVIADQHQVESLAGIMGGDATAVSDETRSIYIEAAFWWPQAVAGRSRRYNFSTDAGHRFERGVDPALTVAHIERITALILQVCGTGETQVARMDDQTLSLPERKPLSMRVERAAKVIGMPLTQAQCLQALDHLGLSAQAGEGATVCVQAPSWRFDLQIEEDLIEEVARMVGYNALPTTAPLAPITPKLRAERLRNPYAPRRLLAARGYQETINFSFVQEEWERTLAGCANPIRVLNPIASPLAVMRTSLMGSLLQVLKFNVDRKSERVRLFEVGRVFLRNASVQDSDSTVAGLEQPLRVAGIAYGPAHPLGWQGKPTPVDFYDVKADVEALLAPSVAEFRAAEHPALHPGRSAQIVLDGQPIGWLGELHPRWRQQWDLPLAPLLFELDWNAVLQRTVPAASPVSKYPSVQRDLALVVTESISHAALRAAVWASPAQALLRDMVLFDIYRAKPDSPQSAQGLAAGEKSMAIRLTLARDDASLTEEEIDQAMQALAQHLTQSLGARLRA